MATIVFAWELGGGGGHLTQIAPIAIGLRGLGHDVAVIGRDRATAARLLAGSGVSVHQAPALAGAAPPARYADSYAEVLLRCGYAHQAGLRRMIRGWREAFDRLRPDLIVADFAPTAMLAARLCGTPVAVIGQGYTIPPRRRPMPFTRPWDPEPTERLAKLDEAATAAMNRALGAAGSGVRLASVEALFEVAATFLCNFAELDHYDGREDSDYYGPIYADSLGIEPPWPRGDGTRVFAYLNGAHLAFRPLLAALRELGTRTVLYARGLDPAEAAAAGSADLRVVTEPVHLGHALTDSGMIICQGIGTASAALVAGRPVLLLPEYLEQIMTLNCLARRGLGAGVARDADADSILSVSRQVLGRPEFRRNAEVFAAYYDGFSPALPVAAIIDVCNDVISVGNSR